MKQKLIPELDVTDIQASRAFYVATIGFEIRYDRPEEKFAFLDFEGISIMLQEADGPGRRFRTGALERPFGRGVNFQIEVTDVDALYSKIIAAGSEIIIPIEEMWYRSENEELGNRQFVVSDPDGYLLRFFTDLGVRRCDKTRKIGF